MSAILQKRCNLCQKNILSELELLSQRDDKRRSSLVTFFSCLISSIPTLHNLHKTFTFLFSEFCWSIFPNSAGVFFRNLSIFPNFSSKIYFFSLISRSIFPNLNFFLISRSIFPNLNFFPNFQFFTSMFLTFSEYFFQIFSIFLNFFANFPENFLKF